MSPRRTGTIYAELEFASRAVVDFSPDLEVSLDCHVCRRCHRTVIFRSGALHGVCTPTRHDFPGRLLSSEASERADWRSSRYLIDYEYVPFRDAKYPESAPSEGAPTWARVSFKVKCPACGVVSPHSTQNNIVRPWRCTCKCGGHLYNESLPMPTLSWQPGEVT
jgi:hypothetical protein